ncbi:MAG TPA: NUDIX domain-containing protein [Anaerolineae bacterium]|nr:NUDIX domain-containing protein [Anaerolineae bacterium]
MPNFGVTVAVIHDRQVLLTRREDFRVWCLPGGAVESGESVAEAAMREVRQHATWPFAQATTRSQVYALLQQGAVPIEQLQSYVCKLPQPNDELLEVPGDSLR